MEPQSNSESPSSPAKPDKPKAFLNFHHWWVIIFVLLLVFIIPALILNLLVLKNQATPTPSANSESDQVSPPTPVLTSDSTANWKTYSNEEFGFEFKYPSRWVLTENKNINDQFRINLSDPTLIDKNCISSYIYDCPRFDVGLIVDTNPEKLALTTSIQRAFGFKTEMVSIQNFTGREFIKVISKQETGAYYWLYAEHNNNIFIINPSRGRNDRVEIDNLKTSRNLEIFDLILSTFRWLDQETETSTWNTYNGEYVNFKYPTSWNPHKRDLCCGAVMEDVELGIPEVRSDQSLGFSSVIFENLSPPDDLDSEMLFIISGKHGVKQIRKGSGYVSYDYITPGHGTSGTFGIHVTVSEANKELEGQLDQVARSVTFK